MLCIVSIDDVQAQTIYEKADKFKGTKTFFTLDRDSKMTFASLLLNTSASFSLQASAETAGTVTPFTLFVETETPDWVFIGRGESLILMLDGSDLIKLTGAGSAASRDIVSAKELHETAGYGLTLDQLARIGRAKKVEFRVYGEKQTLTGQIAASFMRDAAAFAEKGPALLGLNMGTSNREAASSAGNSLASSLKNAATPALPQMHLGIKGMPVPTAMVSNLKLPDATGVWIASVDPHSVAEAAGIEIGDVVLKYNGMAIHTPADLTDLVGKTEKDQSVVLTLWHNYAEKSVEAKFGANAEFDAAGAEKVERFGARGMALPPTAASRLNRPNADGVLVAAVAPNSIARAAGIAQADIILKFNGVDVPGVAALNDLITKTEAGQTLPIVLWRQNNEVTVQAHF